MTFPRGRGAARLVLAALVTLGAAACGTAQAASTTSSQHLPPRDLRWLNQAHQANEAEVQTGELAESNAGTAAVRAAGAMMVSDHSALDAALIATANRLHVSLVGYQTVGQVEVSDQLSKEQGFAFDNDYEAAMLTAHKVMIKATQAEISHGSSPAIVALAGQALPVLQKHLKMLRAAAGSL